MPYEEDYKMWLEKMLIESNPDWICDGMYDKEITRNWCVDYCGEDDEYITPRCLHMYYHHIAKADRKTENSSEKPNNCDTCRNKGFEGCEQPCLGCGCCGLYEPKDEPTTEDCSTVDKDINVRSKDEPQSGKE